MGLKVKKYALPNELPTSVCVPMDVPAPAFIEVSMRSQEDVEPTTQVSPLHRLLVPWITKALPNVGH